MKNKIRVGTRGSNLALAQTKWVVNQLMAHDQDVECEIKIIQTKGDLIQNVSLEKIGDKGLFVKEIEQQLLADQIDLAVHSMKDMPSVSPKGLTFAKTPKREDARDVLVLKSPYTSLTDLPKGAIIGTGSKRRKFQLLKLRPDLNVVPIRGNIETRMAKIASEGLDGIVLAAAGMLRAGHQEKITEYLAESAFIPAPAQGALALQVREENQQLLEMLNLLADEETQIQVAAERGFLEGIGGTCHQPIGAYCQLSGNDVVLTGLFGNDSGTRLVEHKVTGSVIHARELGLKLAQAIVEALEDGR